LLTIQEERDFLTAVTTRRVEAKTKVKSTWKTENAFNKKGHIAVNFQDKDPETGLVAVFCMDFEEIVEEQKKALKQENKEFETFKISQRRSKLQHTMEVIRASKGVY
jgi:hypothetical protein